MSILSYTCLLQHIRTTSLLPALVLSALFSNLIRLSLLEFLRPLFLAFALQFLNLLLGAVLDQIALAIDATPLWQSVRNVHDTLSVKHVAPWFEVFLVFVGFQVDEGGEEEDHVASFVHDGGVAEGAADFAGELVRDGLRGTRGTC
jgi:hypothetical protein